MLLISCLFPFREGKDTEEIPKFKIKGLLFPYLPDCLFILYLYSDTDETGKADVYSVAGLQYASQFAGCIVGASP